MTDQGSLLMDISAGIIDYIVVLIYIVSLFSLAIYSSNKFKKDHDEITVDDQYLAGKSLTFWESLCSLIATEVSALTFVGIPAFAYTRDFTFIQVYFGAIWGRIIIAKIILPKLYDKGLTVYGVMAKDKATTNGQRAVSLIYMLNKILAVGVRLYSGSILIAEFFRLDIYTSVAIISLITFFYTLIGGLKAVVRTDIIQMCLFCGGGLLAHYLIPQIGNTSWSEMMMMAAHAGKLKLIDWSAIGPVIAGFFGGFLFDIGTHGIDQDYMQRLIANRSEKTAGRAIMLSSFFSMGVGFLFLGVGALLWAYYQSVLPPEGVKADYLFAYFITHHFPTGVKGLMVAGALAATMSTLDSSLNALSACLHNDILKIVMAIKCVITFVLMLESLLS
jgi:SSS family solute:Na+ symporter